MLLKIRKSMYNLRVKRNTQRAKDLAPQLEDHVRKVDNCDGEWLDCSNSLVSIANSMNFHKIKVKDLKRQYSIVQDRGMYFLMQHWTKR